MGINELVYKNTIIAYAHFYLVEILHDYSVRKNLHELYRLYINYPYESSMENFYLLYYAWDELEKFGENYYFDGLNLSNIEAILKAEAKRYIDIYVNGVSIEDIDTKDSLVRYGSIQTIVTKEHFESGFMSKIKKWFLNL